MRKLVYQTLIEDTALNALGVSDESVFEQHGLDTPKPRPFVVTRWGIDEVGVGTLSRRSLNLWVHDTPGTYANIDAVLLRARTVLEGLVATQDPDGGWINQIEWQGESEDLADDAQGTVVRFATFRVIGSRP